MTDWASGDLALCIREGSWLAEGIGPRCGQILPVARVYTRDEVDPIGPPNPANTCYLEFAPWAPNDTFGCSNFIKVTPGEMTGGDLEVVTLMASKPVTMRR